MQDDKTKQPSAEDTEELDSLCCPVCGVKIAEYARDGMPGLRTITCPNGHTLKLPYGILEDGSFEVVVPREYYAAV